MEFVLVPAGTFNMGSPDDERYHEKSEVQHQVTISKPFYLQTTEVTLGQWRKVMGRRLFGRRKGKDDMPAVKVSFYDAMRFIEKLTRQNDGVYRLPSEAEWEYAARAGSTSAYTWGDSIDCSRAMYGNNRKKSNKCVDFVRSKGLDVDGPAPVKSYPPNRWGLYDMHGNVWEWCQDWFGGLASEAQIDPGGPDSGSNKVRRGGSWFGSGPPCRSANRAYGHPATRYKTTGFRLVWSKEGDLIEAEKPSDWLLEEEEESFIGQ
jgi:formylglycine-generating enzyme required for sulfatase activity